jgi:hypothetical protein
MKKFDKTEFWKVIREFLLKSARVEDVTDRANGELEGSNVLLAGFQIYRYKQYEKLLYATKRYATNLGLESKSRLIDERDQSWTSSYSYGGGRELVFECYYLENNVIVLSVEELPMNQFESDGELSDTWEKPSDWWK